MNGQCILPDPLSTSNPTFQTASNPLKPTSLWGKAIPPYPTNYFWTNVVLENGFQLSFFLKRKERSFKI